LDFQKFGLKIPVSAACAPQAHSIARGDLNFAPRHHIKKLQSFSLEFFIVDIEHNLFLIPFFA